MCAWILQNENAFVLEGVVPFWTDVKDLIWHLWDFSLRSK